jgi:hypothetical protein
LFIALGGRILSVIGFHAWWLVGFRGAWLAAMHGRVVAARGLVIFFIFIDPCAGRQSLSLPLAKESGWGASGVRT